MRKFSQAPLVLTVAIALGVPTVATAADPDAVQRKLDATAHEYHEIEDKLTLTEDRLAQLEHDVAQADVVFGQKADALSKRATFLYRTGGPDAYIEGLLSAQDLAGFMRKIRMLEVIGSNDSKLVEELQITKARSGELREKLQAARASQRSLLSSLKNKQRQLELELRGAKAAAKISRYGEFESFTLPVSPSAFTNSWGAPRSGGRRHKGTDLMAPCGAPVVAVTNGVITDMHSGGNGGIMLWLRATNGDVFFYSHLQRYAPSAHEGKRVTTGELIGYNGNTGNARGGACHVHFEWHPNGGAAVNPYPLLAAIR